LDGGVVFVGEDLPAGGVGFEWGRGGEEVGEADEVCGLGLVVRSSQGRAAMILVRRVWVGDSASGREMRMASRTRTTVWRELSPGKESASMDAVTGRLPGLAGLSGKAVSASPQGGRSMGWDWREPSASRVSWVRMGSGEKFLRVARSVVSWPTTGVEGWARRRVTAMLGGEVVATLRVMSSTSEGRVGEKSRQAEDWKSEMRMSWRWPWTGASWRRARSMAALRDPASGRGWLVLRRSVRKVRLGPGSGNAAEG
jgi:hypothetical protein